MDQISRVSVPALPGVIISLALAACASAPRPQAAALPENLKVPDGNTFLLRAAARGAQIYTCKPKAGASPAAFAWALKAPEAELFDQSGVKIGHHYGGPTWESNDGSRVVGEMIQASPAQGAVAWLLLRAKSHEGAGALANVTYIQRVDTSGGVAPSAGCDEAHAGAEARVEYSANYDFYSAR